MPLQLPNLDDRRYADLLDEARALIPTYAPDWTNHNPSDPGITLVELFAFLSEMLIYRLNRITSANVLSFLKLLNGTDWDPFQDDGRKLTDAEKAAVAERLRQLSENELVQFIGQQLPKAVVKLRRLERAVSPGDFERLALEADSRVARARCLPRRNLTSDREQEKPGNVSVIILPGSGAAAQVAELIARVQEYLSPTLLLTTQFHVVGPQFLTVRIKATVVLLPDEPELAVPGREQLWVGNRIVKAVKDFFDPLPREGEEGWAFGRNAFVSDLYGLLDAVSGVDYIEDITLTTTTPGRLITDGSGKLIGVEVKPYELVEAQISTTDVTLLPPVTHS